MPTDTEARAALARLLVPEDYSPPGIIEQMESDIATLRAYIERAEAAKKMLDERATDPLANYRERAFAGMARDVLMGEIDAFPEDDHD